MRRLGQHEADRFRVAAGVHSPNGGTCQPQAMSRSLRNSSRGTPRDQLRGSERDPQISQILADFEDHSLTEALSDSQARLARDASPLAICVNLRNLWIISAGFLGRPPLDECTRGRLTGKPKIRDGLTEVPGRGTLQSSGRRPATAFPISIHKSQLPSYAVLGSRRIQVLPPGSRGALTSQPPACCSLHDPNHLPCLLCVAVHCWRLASESRRTQCGPDSILRREDPSRHRRKLLRVPLGQETAGRSAAGSPGWGVPAPDRSR